MSTDEDVAVARRRLSGLSERTRRLLVTAAVAHGALRVACSWASSADRPVRSAAETGAGRSRRTRQLRRSRADLVLRLRASAALIRLPAREAEGQAVWAEPSRQVPGERLVSFLVSFMYVYLRPSPCTTAL